MLEIIIGVDIHKSLFYGAYHRLYGGEVSGKHIGKGSDELFFVHKVHFRLLEPLPSVGLYIFVFCPVHI